MVKIHSFIFLLTILTAATAISIFDDLFSFKGNNSDLALTEKACKCLNGRCVTDNRGISKCACKYGYALQDEETCEVCDCGSTGKCFFALMRFSDGTVRYEKKCLCDKGYAPKDGVCIECVCGENSKCEFEGDDKICYCIEGYSERYGVCTECNCGDFGECKFDDGNKKCACDPNYLVNNGICEECDCGNYGSCSFQNGMKTCSCDTGYKVKNGKCEKCDCGYYGVDCRFEDQTKICECKSGYAQKYLTCEACNCGEHSTGCKFAGAQKHCICERGYVQKGDVCRVGCGVYRDCQNGGECKCGFCKCLPGTRGEFCENIDECPDLCPNQKDSVCSYDVVKQRAYCQCMNRALSYDILTAQCKKTCSDDFWRCENGGSCVQSGDFKFCRCLEGTSGDMCEIVDDCSSGRLACGNDARCVFDVGKGRAICECIDPQKAYNTFFRQCRRTCDELVMVCKNGGVCSVVDDYEFCRCPPGTSGDHCEIVDECVTNRDKCKDNAECYFDVRTGTAACKCRDPQKKYDTRRDRCIVTCDEVRTCRNGGLCGGDFCDCIDGTSGDLCEIVDDCASGRLTCGSDARCVFDVMKRTARCLCVDPQKSYNSLLKQCRRTCDDTMRCRNGGKCSIVDDYEFCICPPGTSGDHCEVVDECMTNKDKCKDNAECYFDVRTGAAACRCRDPQKKYDTRRERCIVTCDETRTCRNGGLCGGDFCDCIDGTSGDLCEIVDDCVSGRLTCGSDARCVFDVVKRAARCLCIDPHKSYNTMLRQCKRACDDSMICQNGGECTVVGDYEFCRCPPGTSGDHCEIVDECVANRDKCKDNAECYFDVRTGVAGCKCRDPQKKYDTRREKCLVTCDETRPCRNGGLCGGDFCDCIDGTSGDLCEIVDDCASGRLTCASDARCVFDVVKRKAKCLCLDPQKSYNSLLRQCRKTCDDITMVCENGGECTSIGDYEFCKCPPGTSGDHCEVVDECVTNRDKCKDNAECYFDVRTGVAGCKCRDPQKKYDTRREKCIVTCDETRNCKNGGVCGGDFCDCIDGTSGDLCEIVDDCASGRVTCGSDAKCVFDIVKRRAKCLCLDPQKSYNSLLRQCRKVCDDTIRCKNGGECASIDDYEFCMCPPGTSGDHCEVVDECVRNKYMCKDNAECYFDVRTGTAACRCNDPQKKYDTRRERCVVTCDVTRKCKNGGLCGRDDLCDCNDGTSGDLCEIIDDCQKGLCGFDKSVQCTYDPVRKGGICGCWDASLTYDPTTKTCRVCDCGRRAISCEFRNGEKVCNCLEGFAVRNGRCAKTRCIEKRCTNGNCYIGEDGEQEICKCPEGFVLDQDSCRRVDCKGTVCNMGTCVVRPDGIEDCVCPEGHLLIGDGCVRKTCRVETCFGGRCDIIQGESYCICPHGYHLQGIGCFATVCQKRRCFGGVCFVTKNKEICTCPAGYVLLNDVCTLGG